MKEYSETIVVRLPNNIDSTFIIPKFVAVDVTRYLESLKVGKSNDDTKIRLKLETNFDCFATWQRWIGATINRTVVIIIN